MILFLCYVFPPLAVLLMGRPFSAIGNLFATCFMWAPGVRHALVCYADYKVEKGITKVTKAINNPTWTKADDARSLARVQRGPREKRQAIPVYQYDCNDVGMNGTKFRRK